MKPKIKPAFIGVANYPKKVADDFYHSAEWQALRRMCFQRDGNRCVVCGERASIADHIVSRKNGGKDDLSNLRSLCRPCDNRVKEDAAGDRRSGGKF